MWLCDRCRLDSDEALTTRHKHDVEAQLQLEPPHSVRSRVPACAAQLLRWADVNEEGQTE